ncbi:MAG TPA: gliding motility-associated ABC transporter ATP-binding subunit GldA [Flavobacteriaceae bacterium]|nr:gliding motility-associated ABC transporter ATP-binding subunit GldA [Flavobacteriaceae bacterium]
MSIQVENIVKKYGEQEALKSINFSLKKGEIVGLLGPNGAGKSTLMKILTTYITPTSGNASVSGYDIDNETLKVRQSIGYLPEHNPLYLDMYVREYLLYNASIYKVDKNKIEGLIERTGLLSHANKKIGELSKGYRQRVGLASALLHDPEVLILDEPTTGLDPNQLIDIRELIKEVGKEKTVLLSTHIMQEVEAMCDRVIILHQGAIVLDKKIDALIQSQIIEVEFDYRLEEVAFKQLPHLIKVDSLSGNLHQLHFDTEEDMRAVVYDFAKEQGLRTLQLHQKSPTLEKLFIELTQQK